MTIFVLSIIAPSGRAHQPRCPGSQGRARRILGRKQAIIGRGKLAATGPAGPQAKR